jgi:hypothetical protein
MPCEALVPSWKLQNSHTAMDTTFESVQRVSTGLENRKVLCSGGGDESITGVRGEIVLSCSFEVTGTRVSFGLRLVAVQPSCCVRPRLYCFDFDFVGDAYTYSVMNWDPF